MDVPSSRSPLTPTSLALSAIGLGTAGLVGMKLFPLALPEVAYGLMIGLALGLAFAAFLRWRLPQDCDAARPALKKRYVREMSIAMVAYVVLLIISLSLINQVDQIAIRALLALLPVPPIGLVLRAMIRYIRDTDELQQRIELESVSIASAGLALVYMTGGFLQQARVVDIPSGAAMIWVFPLLCALYGLAKVLVAARYR